MTAMSILCIDVAVGYSSLQLVSHSGSRVFLAAQVLESLEEINSTRAMFLPWTGRFACMFCSFLDKESFVSCWQGRIVEILLLDYVHG